MRTANAHRDACGRLGVGPVPRRRAGRRLAAAAFVLALATVAFAATVASLSGLATPAPATPTTVTAPGYVPVPAGPPFAARSTSSTGGGR